MSSSPMIGAWWGLALVPAEGDPGRLTQPDALGCMPPVARRWPARDARTWERTPPSAEVVLNRATWRSQEVALAVWWDDALAPAGWDRLRRVLAGLPRDQRPTGPLWGWLHDFRPWKGDVLVGAEFAVQFGLASRVALIDEVDGVLVERVPLAQLAAQVR